VLNGAEGGTALTASTSFSLDETTANNKVCIIHKEFIPANAPLGASNQVTIKAEFDYTGTLANIIYTRQDLTNVSNVALFLQKEVCNLGNYLAPTSCPEWKTSNTAKKDDLLEYRITYTNNGSTPINTLVINDATPPYTTFISAACGTTPTSLSLACNPPIPPNIPAMGGTGAIKWFFDGSLTPGASGTVTFQVKVD
jgi:uncharacterized repeat protein (TIGR01451 family)